jgi:predicted TIM-barrel enzyme
MATQIACHYMDVVTTSGSGTGMAAEPEKIKTMSTVAKKYNKKLGIASGITPNNIKDYESVTYFLVATGISKDFHTFNPLLVKELSEKIHKLN